MEDYSYVFFDDLLMFCRADIQSVKLLYIAFIKFSKASGLQENVEKSSIYTTRVFETLKAEIIQHLGFSKGTLLFKYLRVPLAAKRLSIGQCWPLVEKTIAKINC